VDAASSSSLCIAPAPGVDVAAPIASNTANTWHSSLPDFKKLLRFILNLNPSLSYIYKICNWFRSLAATGGFGIFDTFGYYFNSFMHFIWVYL